MNTQVLHRVPVIADHGTTTVQVHDASHARGFRVIRVYGWDSEGYPLVLAGTGTPEEGRLVRAQDRPDYKAVLSRKHGTEREQDIPAAAGWYALIIALPADADAISWQYQVGQRYPVMLWRYCGPADVRAVVPRPRLLRSGEDNSQRGSCLDEFGIRYHLIGPGETYVPGRDHRPPHGQF